MLFKDENYSLTSEELYNEILNESDKKSYYLYHYIIVKYKNGNYEKIDQVKDLNNLKNKEILCKYYLKKIHYYTGLDHFLDEYGEPYYIYNLGYFFVGGLVDTSEEEKVILEKMFESYEDNYKNMVFPFTDEEFLSLNKSVINF